MITTNLIARYRYFLVSFASFLDSRAWLAVLVRLSIPFGRWEDKSDRLTTHLPSPLQLRSANYILVVVGLAAVVCPKSQCELDTLRPKSAEILRSKTQLALTGLLQSK